MWSSGAEYNNENATEGLQNRGETVRFLDMWKPLVLLSCLLVPLVASGEVRTWTSSDGRAVSMELVKADAAGATFSLNGKEMTLPLDKLSEGDQEFIKEWLANVPEKPPEPVEWPEAVEVRASASAVAIRAAAL